MPDHNARRRGWTLLALLIGGVLMVTLGPAAAPSAAGAHPTPLASGVWAYGAYRNASESGVAGNATVAVSATLGYQMLLTQIFSNGTAFSLEAQRTAVQTFHFVGCIPGCLTGRALGTLSVRATEVDLAFANFTTTGTVLVNGSAVPALALRNAQSSTQANLTEAWSTQVHTALGSVRATHASLTIDATTREMTAFVPALGIVPSNVTPGENWTSASTAASTGAWGVTYAFNNSSATGVPYSTSGAPHGSASGTQLVTLQGRDAGTVVLTGPVSADAILLNITGPFHAREGFILVPGQSDLFGVSHGPWEPLEAGQQGASTTAIDYAPAGGGHLGWLASSTAFQGQTSAAATPAAAVTPLAASGPGANSVLQAEPEPYAEGQQNSQCLLTSCSTPRSPSSTPLAPDRWVLGAISAGGVAALLVGAVVVDRRRQIPEPARTPSRRYPPAVLPATTPSSSTAGPARPTEPTLPDPLDHLW